MPLQLASSKRDWISIWVLASLLALMAPLHAAPVVNGPDQPATRLIDASQWVPTDQPVPTTDPQRGMAPETRPTPTSLPRPPVVSAVGAPPGPADAAAPKLQVIAPAVEPRNAVKEALRPLYDELSNSDAAQVVRGLQSELSMGKEQVLSSADATLSTRPEGANPPLESAGWDGQGYREAPRTAAQVERDKVLASVLMEQLIDQVMPWAIGLLALYALFYLTKLTVAYGRLRSQRRREIRVRRSSRSRPSAGGVEKST